MSITLQDIMRLKYKEYLFRLLFSDIDEIIDTRVMSYDEFVSNTITDNELEEWRIK